MSATISGSIVGQLLSLLKIDLSDEFYDLPDNERNEKLNEMFPAWLESLSTDKRAEINGLFDDLMRPYKREMEIRAMEKNLLPILAEIQLEHAAELSSTIKFTSSQMYKLDDLTKTSKKKKQTTTHETK